MDENKFQKHAVVIMIIGLLLLLLPMAAISVEQSKPPEWVLDTIILPIPKDNNIYRFGLYKDKNGKILYCWGVQDKSIFDLATHQSIDWSSLKLLKKPKSNNIPDIVDCLEGVEDYFFEVPNIFTYKIELGSFAVDRNSTSNAGKCNSPLGKYIGFSQENNIDNYLFLISSKNKFEFETRHFCGGMNGKEKIEIHNLGLSLLIWILDNNRILLGSPSNPYFIIIDANKIDLALKSKKTLIFDHDGVKGYWVRKSLIDRCINKAELELTHKGYNIYSMKPLEGNMSVNEYIDQEITKKLNKPD
jgi:hypothetical protein